MKERRPSASDLVGNSKLHADSPPGGAGGRRRFIRFLQESAGLYQTAKAAHGLLPGEVWMQ